MDDLRDARADMKEPPVREALRRHSTFAVATSSQHRRENEHADPTRKDKGKAVDRLALSNISSRRSELPEPGDGQREKQSIHATELERLRMDVEMFKKMVADQKKAAKKQGKVDVAWLEDLKAQLLAETHVRPVTPFLKSEIFTPHPKSKVKKEQETQLQALKAKVEKKDELIASIETSIQCQICMDTLHKPHALSLCGHILCLLCLQEWFRKAPPSADDSYMNQSAQDDPNYILMRPKSCPCCRAVVPRRPVPVFVVKAVAAALVQYKSGLNSPEVENADEDEDPWKGLFIATDEEDEDMYCDAYSSDEDYGDPVEWAMQAPSVRFAQQLLLDERRFMLRYQVNDEEDDLDEVDDVVIDVSGSEDGGEDQASDDDVGFNLSSSTSSNSSIYPYTSSPSMYVPAQWEPPRGTPDADDYARAGPAALRLLRRGCTPEMVRRFGMAYTHARGLVAHLPSLDPEEFARPRVNGLVPARMHRVFLGWNLRLAPGDYTGERYMRSVLEEMKEYPDRWGWNDRGGGRGRDAGRVYLDARRLVSIDQVEEYDTTDTEVWVDAGMGAGYS
ncbi:hypothetical protein H0H81_011917 [Sphagnurus paluster]|uniref:RING-type domain-containing protein n=1 Tax=Sphagnurus paluster TaxID=117069 RepID=A0A9P7FWQ3_9AGAR|nr:hypothetical protein H0H81_011917 [Sphagnurus paluster]